jgi:hypothetical protein
MIIYFFFMRCIIRLQIAYFNLKNAYYRAKLENLKKKLDE